MLDLKNCPFCGGKATFAKTTKGWKVECEGRWGTCTINARTHYQPTKGQAVAAWNRRDLQAVGPEPTVAVKPLVERIDALLAFENPVPPIPNLARSLLASARSALVATPPAERVVETDWINYRPLAEGEIIQDGDECLTDSHLGWQPAANTVGSAAPDPSYTAHRMYRRPLATKPAVKDDETVVERDQPENITYNPKSWIAWKREAKRLTALLAAQEQGR